jgi:hypothetical protein
MPQGGRLRYRQSVAKLVPAVCPKCGANVQLDPDREFVTCQFCGASSFVQTQKRPVTQQVHAMHMPVIHVTRPQTGCATALIVLSILGGVGAAIAGVVVSMVASNAATAVATAVTFQPPLPTPAVDGNSTTTEQPQPSGPLVEEDYFGDATKAKARYEKVLGKPIMAKQLVIYQYYAMLEAQNPKNPEHVDSYKLWANKVERPDPIRLGSDKKQLSQLLFSLDGVDFTLLPKLIKQALSELKIEEGKVTHVMLERDSFNAKRDPVWRVYVNGSRDSGFMEFSVTGEKRRSAQ